jgi:hypothetical protein
MSDDELTKAIIGTIGDVDAYQLPGGCPGRCRMWGLDPPKGRNAAA